MTRKSTHQVELITEKMITQKYAIFYNIRMNKGNKISRSHWIVLEIFSN